MKLRDPVYFAAGMVFLALAKAKNLLRGYSSPKPFDIAETQRCIDYDELVVQDWMQALARYNGGNTDVSGKSVLELGPGSDLGIGLLLLARGARDYNACDVNNLVATTPRKFYDKLFEHLAAGGRANIDHLREQLDKRSSGVPSLLNYVVRNDFDLSAAFGDGKIDLVFSQAAFEHFDDVDKVVRQLSGVCKPGAMIVAEIDLKTHSRWIRDKDPNNIYRYPDLIYRTFWFRGIPNRVRPYQYRAAFERHGWGRIEIIPRTRLEEPPSVSRRFRGEINQMDCLTFILCATKSPAAAAGGGILDSGNLTPRESFS